MRGPHLLAVLLALHVLTHSIGAADTLDPHLDLADLNNSFTCLGCHDGTMARNVNGHPVDVDYDLARLKIGSRLRPRFALPASVRLESGRVGCVSCHDVLSTTPNRLSYSNQRSGLCFACHDL